MSTETPEIFFTLAQTIRQWYLEDVPSASGFVHAMLDPNVFAPLLELMYLRFDRNRREYLEIEDAGWGRNQSIYKWIAHYFTTTNPQYPDSTHIQSGVPNPLTTIEQGTQHFLTRFEQELAVEDTMTVRETDRVERYAAMCGEDNDCPWHYMGSGYGPTLHSMVTKQVGNAGINADLMAHKTRYAREFINNPTAQYGLAFQQAQDAASRAAGNDRYGLANY